VVASRHLAAMLLRIGDFQVARQVAEGGAAGDHGYSSSSVMCISFSMSS